MKNLFVVIEGIDRAGKNTLLTQIKPLLQPNAIELDFPQRQTPIGHLIDKYLKKELKFNMQSINLLYAANRWEFKDQITNRNSDIISCRYSLSGISYSISKLIESESRDDYINWIQQPEKMLPMPDLTILVLADPLETCKREGFGDEIHDELEFQKRCMENFRKYSETLYDNVFVYDGKNFEELKNEILKLRK